MFWDKSKIKVKSTRKYAYSIKKLTTFGGKEWFFPIVREDNPLSIWDVIYRANERSLVVINLEVATTDYAVETKEEAEDYIVQYKEFLKKQIEADIQREEVLEYKENNLNEAKDENEN